jgi:hypothetical protein
MAAHVSFQAYLPALHLGGPEQQPHGAIRAPGSARECDIAWIKRYKHNEATHVDAHLGR